MTRDQLNKLHELTAEIKKQSEVASELLRIAQDRFNHVEHELERDGKQVKIKEKTLWEEVWHLGSGCQAGKTLQKEHPEVFAAYKKEAELSAGLEIFCRNEFGLDFKAMSLSDYLRMTEEMFALLLSEKVKE